MRVNNDWIVIRVGSVTKVLRYSFIERLFQHIRSPVLLLESSLNLPRNWPLVALLVGVVVGLVRVLVVVLVSLVAIADNLVDINARKF